MLAEKTMTKEGIDAQTLQPPQAGIADCTVDAVLGMGYPARGRVSVRGVRHIATDHSPLRSEPRWPRPTAGGRTGT